MNSTYPISPRVAEQAAKDYCAIVRAGLVRALEIEIEASIAAHYGPDPYPWPCTANHQHREARRLDRHRDGNGWYLRPIHDDAEHLAKLLDCNASAVFPYVFDAEWDQPTTRTIVLACLRDVANQARKQEAEKNRRQNFAGRRAS